MQTPARRLFPTVRPRSPWASKSRTWSPCASAPTQNVVFDAPADLRSPRRAPLRDVGTCQQGAARRHPSASTCRPPLSGSCPRSPSLGLAGTARASGTLGCDEPASAGDGSPFRRCARAGVLALGLAARVGRIGLAAPEHGSRRDGGDRGRPLSRAPREARIARHRGDSWRRYLALVRGRRARACRCRVRGGRLCVLGTRQQPHGLDRRSEPCRDYPLERSRRGLDQPGARTRARSAGGFTDHHRGCSRRWSVLVRRQHRALHLSGPADRRCSFASSIRKRAFRRCRTLGGLVE